MVQALPTGEIKVCMYCNDYTQSSSKKCYIYTIDVKYNVELKQKTKKNPFFSRKDKG